MEWKDQYKHPKWQKKRLEAMEAADYCCQSCGDSESQLQVHHKRYVKGRKMWEYPISELSVLCGACHEEQHSIKDSFGEIVANISPEGMRLIVGLVAGYCAKADGVISLEPEIIDSLNVNKWPIFTIGLCAAFLQSIALNKGTSSAQVNKNLAQILKECIKAEQEVTTLVAKKKRTS